MQGSTPVFHVRGPRITADDFKTLASQVTAPDSRWILMFPGSGAFATQLAGDKREVLASECDTMFTSDPVGMPVLLKLVREKPSVSFEGLCEEFGRATGAWYAERNLARTEEPTLWAGTARPRLLAAGAETNYFRFDGRRPNQCPSAPSSPRRPRPSSGELPAAWKAIKRVEPQKYPDADAVILSRRCSYTLGQQSGGCDRAGGVHPGPDAGGQALWGLRRVAIRHPMRTSTSSTARCCGPDGKLVRLDPDAIRERARAIGGRLLSRGSGSSSPCRAWCPARCCTCATRRTWKTVPAAARFAGDSDRAGPAGAGRPRSRSSVPKETPFHFALEQISAADPVIKQTQLRHDLSVALREPARRRQREMLMPPGQRLAPADLDLPGLGGVCRVVWPDQQADG